MDCQVGWTAKAYADVEQIAAYIAEDSPYYAQMVVEKIIDVSRTLDHFPERGRVAPDLEDTNVREVFVYSYRLLYEVEGNQVMILGDVHGARLMENVRPL